MVLSHSRALRSQASSGSASTAILGGVQVSLTLLEKSVDGMNIPFIKGVAGAALEVIKIAKAIQSNREGCENLVERSTSLLVVILGSLSGKTEDAIPDHLRRGVERLTGNFSEVLAELRIIDKRAQGWRAAFYYLDNGEKLKDCSVKLQWAMEEFQVTTNVDSCLKQLEHYAELRKGQERLQNGVDGVQNGMDGLQQGQDTIRESQQELLKGQASIEKSIKAVRDGLSGVQGAIKEQSNTQDSSSGPSTVMPPEPKLFGRDEYIDRAIKLLFSITGAKIAILGPGGMGKTSVALKIIYNALVVDRFGDNRCWIPCEQATSVPFLLELIAKSLNLPGSSSNDRLADIVNFLKTTKLPYILLLDNLETPWDIEGQQSNVAEVLATIACIPSVSFIITMRGNQPPSSDTIEWTEPRLPSLTQLDPDAAEEAFLRIGSNAKGDPELRTLLQKLDYMPLAITLMARLSEAGETVADLLEQWKSERTRLLDQPGGDRRNSIEVSIKLSLESRSVKGSPDALRLLSVLAMLPAGTALARLPDMCPSISGWRAALRVLRGAALVYDSADKSRIQMLSPIQSYILLHHPLGQEPLRELRASYYKLAPERKTEPRHPEFKNVVEELAIEETNMEAILINALHDRHGDREAAITISLSYTLYLFYQHPRTEIIAEAVQVAKETKSQQLPDCLKWHAMILRQQDRYDESESSFAAARDEFKKLGSVVEVADCNGLIGDLLSTRGLYDEARDLLQQAVDTLLALGDVEGAAWRRRDIGTAFFLEQDYQSACSIYQQARSEFDSVGNRLGSLRCLRPLGEALRLQGDYDAALSAIEEAWLGSVELGDLTGVAYSLLSLGTTFKNMKNYSMSIAKLEESRAIFTQMGDTSMIKACTQRIEEVRRLLAAG
ncbi:hypothetical protein FRC03_010569 [Tulasnella sp. 419]|nr:hypothetical protein FRC03_010569 [Tulasnella sp. 419]